MIDEINTEVKFASVTWMRAIKVWWSLTWRILLFGFFGGFLIGLILGFILAIMRIDAKTITAICRIAGMVIGIPIGIFVIKIILKKEFSDFRIALIEK